MEREDGIILNVKYDKLSCIITIISLVIFIVFAVIFPAEQEPTVLFYVLCGVLAMAIGSAYILSPRRLKVTEKDVSIERHIGTHTIRIEDIAEIKRRDLTPADIRLMNSGGVFGYIGWNYNKKTGCYFSYMTERENCVEIRLKSGKRIMLSTPEYSRLLCLNWQ